jgi:hypothetical protein
MAATFTIFSKLPREVRLLIWEAALPPRIVELWQDNLKVTLGEWNWKDCPDNPTREDRIKNYNKGGKYDRRIHKLLGFESWEDDYRPVEDLGGLKGLLANTPSEEFDDKVLRNPMPGFRSARRPTQILSVMTACRESYNAASHLYEKIFGTHAAFPETFFDFRRDTLYLRHDIFSKVDPEFDTLLEPLLSVTDTESLARVQNLAILMDTDIGRYEISNEYLMLLFLSKFPNLENLTLVVKHYSLDPDEDDSQAKFSFIDPIDVERTIEIYDKFAPGSYAWQPVKIPTQPSLSLELASFDLKYIEEEREDEIKGNSHRPPWKIPNIHFKVAVTQSSQDRMNSARARCEAIVARLNEDLLKSLGR